MAEKQGAFPSFFSELFTRLRGRLPGAERGRNEGAGASRAPEPKLVFFIVDWNRAAVISRVFDEADVRFRFISKGRGTASSEILNLLGIGSGEKAVALCLEQPETVPELVSGVRQKLGFYSAGAGIAFTIPLSGINAPLMRLFKTRDSAKAGTESSPASPWNGQDRRRSGGEKPPRTYANSLIVSVVNKGSSDEFMKTARGAGARGGTVLNARGQAQEGAVKVFGISVQDEKEVIIILSGGEKTEAITRAVSKAHGPESGARGLVFSLPVDSMMSLSRVE